MQIFFFKLSNFLQIFIFFSRAAHGNPNQPDNFMLTSAGNRGGGMAAWRQRLRLQEAAEAEAVAVLAAELDAQAQELVLADRSGLPSPGRSPRPPKPPHPDLRLAPPSQSSATLFEGFEAVEAHCWEPPLVGTPSSATLPSSTTPA